MNTASSSAHCSLAEGVTWLVEEHGILVIDELSRRSQLLQYPEAAVWDLLVRGHGTRRAATLLRWILAIPEPTAETLIKNCLQEWSDAGWLCESDQEG